MVRNKVVPQQLGDAEQRRRQWDLQDGAAGHAALIVDNDFELEDIQVIEPPAAAAAAHRNDDIGIADLMNDFIDLVDDDDDLDYILPEEQPNLLHRPLLQRRHQELLAYGQFAPILESCEFYVRVSRDSKLEKEDIFCQFGQVAINLLGDVSEFDILEAQGCELWIYVDGFERPGHSALYYEWDDVSWDVQKKRKRKGPAAKFLYFMVSDSLDKLFWQGLSNRRHFLLSLQSFDCETKTVVVQVNFKVSGLINIQFASENIQRLDNFAHVIKYFFHVKMPKYNGEKSLKHSSEVLYRAVKLSHEGQEYCRLDVQHPSLIPKLRQYQKDAVKWMLLKEGVTGDEKNSISTAISCDDDLHCLYVEITSADGVVFYYNYFAGFVVRNKPKAVKSTPGGILSDEMGLGKTVEVLSCMLCNPRQTVPRPDYLEPIEVQYQSKRKLKPLLYYEVGGKSPDVHSELKDLKLADFSKQISESNQPTDEKYIAVRKMKSVPTLNQRPKSLEQKMVKVHLPVKLKSIEHKSQFGILKRKNVCNVSTAEMDGSDSKDYKPVIKIMPMVNRSDVPKRRASQRVSFAEPVDSDYQDDVDTDFSVSEDDEPQPKKQRKSRQNIVPACKLTNKKTIDMEVEDLISSNPFWKTMEAVIVKNCWEDKVNQYKRHGSFKQFRHFVRRRRTDPCYLMNLREQLKLRYENTLAEYSLKSAKMVTSADFKSPVEPKSYFECVCGSVVAERRDDDMRVQCTTCGMWQHANCVQYDVTDPYRGDYVCPHCWHVRDPVISGATLIVAPASICDQWVDEIKKHLKEKSIRMLVYTGISAQGFMQPRQLAGYDIVITAYDTLRRELNYVDLPHSNSEAGRRFRHPKRFMTTPSPLPCVQWWRVCLDEAQMVECTSTKTAEMALRLHAVNRWCVTGTPIQKSLNDLQGLLMFLGVDPYWVPQWWHRCLYEPYCYGVLDPLHSVISKCMWANSKLDVISQLDIPPQMEEVHWLTFTPVEEHFYRRLHGECSYDAQQRLNKFGDDMVKLSDLDRESLTYLLQPLLKLRQACNHPQVVKGQFVSLNRRTMTLDQLLENMIKKTQVEAEESHRVVVSSLNGLAALHVIREEWEEAVDKYREVLNSVTEHSHIKTDSLQRLHTLYNLAELLDAQHVKVQPTLRDGSVRQEVDEIRQKYLAPYPLQVQATDEECLKNSHSVEELENSYLTGGKKNVTPWWLVALQSFDDDFVAAIRDELLTAYSRFEEHKCLLYPVESRVHLQRVLQAETRKMHRMREDMIKGVRHILALDPMSLLDSAIDCHLRPSEVDPPQCLLCATHEFFTDYEEVLFFMKEDKKSRVTEKSRETNDMKDNANVMEQTRHGNWGQSETERVLRYLQTRLLGKVDEEIYEDSQTHMKVLEAMKKEFKNYRILWRAVCGRVAAFDEVNMATLRLRLRLPDEPQPLARPLKGQKKEHKMEREVTLVTHHILEPSQLEEYELKLKSELIVARGELKVKLGQLLYLHNLGKSDTARLGGANPEPCPICQGELGEKWAVLLCGHSFCVDCSRVLTNHGFNGLDTHGIKCPMCRRVTKNREMYFVDTQAKNQTEEETVKVQGSLSTKIEGIVSLMLRIKGAEPQAKVLVFSTWSDVLDVISDGFSQNGITHRSLHHYNKFQANLTSFKRNPEITALLLPIASGANGLNIIEATHVLLVEPLLNPAAELQAVGRVHRIGQMQSTVVHRFAVRDTIEERMHATLHRYVKFPSVGASHCGTDVGITVGDLKRLFLHPQELVYEAEILARGEGESETGDNSFAEEMGTGETGVPLERNEGRETVSHSPIPSTSHE